MSAYSGYIINHIRYVLSLRAIRKAKQVQEYTGVKPVKKIALNSERAVNTESCG